MKDVTKETITYDELAAALKTQTIVVDSSLLAFIDGRPPEVRPSCPVGLAADIIRTVQRNRQRIEDEGLADFLENEAMKLDNQLPVPDHRAQLFRRAAELIRGKTT